MSVISCSRFCVASVSCWRRCWSSRFRLISMRSRSWSAFVEDEAVDEDDGDAGAVDIFRESRAEVFADARLRCCCCGELVSAPGPAVSLAGRSGGSWTSIGARHDCCGETDTAHQRHNTANSSQRNVAVRVTTTHLFDWRRGRHAPRLGRRVRSPRCVDVQSSL